MVSGIEHSRTKRQKLIVQYISESKDSPSINQVKKYIEKIGEGSPMSTEKDIQLLLREGIMLKTQIKSGKSAKLIINEENVVARLSNQLRAIHAGFVELVDEYRKIRSLANKEQSMIAKLMIERKKELSEIEERKKELSEIEERKKELSEIEERNKEVIKKWESLHSLERAIFQLFGTVSESYRYAAIMVWPSKIKDKKTLRWMYETTFVAMVEIQQEIAVGLYRKHLPYPYYKVVPDGIRKLFDVRYHSEVVAPFKEYPLGTKFDSLLDAIWNSTNVFFDDLFPEVKANKWDFEQTNGWKKLLELQKCYEEQLEDI